MTNNRIKLIEAKTLPGYGAYTENARRADEIRGNKDGKAGIPSLSENDHPFRNEIIAKAKAELNNYEESLSAHMKELESEHDRLISERDDRYSARRGQLETERANAVADIDRQLGPQAHTHAATRQEFEEARSRESELEARLGRPLRVSMVTLYVPIMVLIAVCETPINRLAFELFFQETPAISLLVSLGVGAVLAFFAHFVGTWAKRSIEAEGAKRKIGYWAGVVLVLAITGPVLYFIALMRQHFVEMLSRTDASFEQLLEGGIAKAVKAEWNLAHPHSRCSP